jgi:hypothetical protein
MIDAVNFGQSSDEKVRAHCRREEFAIRGRSPTSYLQIGDLRIVLRGQIKLDITIHLHTSIPDRSFASQVFAR